MIRSLTLLIVILGVSPASPAGPPASAGPPAEASQCPAFRYVDRARLPTRENNEPDGAPLEQMWTRWAGEPSGIAWRTQSPGAAIHIETHPGLSPDPTGREVVARQSPDGWEVYARSQDGPLGPRTPWRAVRLSLTSQDRIAAVLSDPCLWSAPRFLDSIVPLRNGRYDSRPDGPSTFYDVSLGDRRWGGWHFSWTVGPPARLRAILLHEAFDEPEWVEPDIGPDGWLDGPD